MKQPYLAFDEPIRPPVVQTPPDTRAEAYSKVKPKVHDLQMMLMRHLYNVGPLSSDQWAIDHNISHMLVRPRMSCLKKAGIVYRMGFGLSVEGNNQDKLALFPYLKERLRTLTEHFSVDEALANLLAEKNVENFAKKRRSK